MAELVDAQVSGTCGSFPVKVRVFSRAPKSLFGEIFSFNLTKEHNINVKADNIVAGVV